MKLTLVPLTRGDIDHIVAHMWERGRAEIERLGVSDMRVQADRLEAMAKEYGYALRDGREPVAAFGADNIEGTYYTFFAATTEFTQHGREITVFLRRFLIERLAERPDARLELGSLCDHPKSDDWFKVLGFKLLKKEGLLRHYLYQHN